MVFSFDLQLIGIIKLLRQLLVNKQVDYEL